MGLVGGAVGAVGAAGIGIGRFGIGAGGSVLGGIWRSGAGGKGALVGAGGGGIYGAATADTEAGEGRLGRGLWGMGIGAAVGGIGGMATGRGITTARNRLGDLRKPAQTPTLSAEARHAARPEARAGQQGWANEWDAPVRPNLTARTGAAARRMGGALGNAVNRATNYKREFAARHRANRVHASARRKLPQARTDRDEMRTMGYGADVNKFERPFGPIAPTDLRSQRDVPWGVANDPGWGGHHPTSTIPMAATSGPNITSMQGMGSPGPRSPWQPPRQSPAGTTGFMRALAETPNAAPTGGVHPLPPLAQTMGSNAAPMRGMGPSSYPDAVRQGKTAGEEFGYRLGQYDDEIGFLRNHQTGRRAGEEFARREGLYDTGRAIQRGAGTAWAQGSPGAGAALPPGPTSAAWRDQFLKQRLYS